MHITKISIENYKSFHEETEILLSPGMNLILGENNSGKSAILDAILPREIKASPHLSEETKPHASDSPSPESTIKLTFSLKKEEARRYLGEQFYILPPPDQPDIYNDFPTFLRAASELDFLITAKSQFNTLSIAFQSIINGRNYGPTQADPLINPFYTPTGKNIEEGQLSNRSQLFEVLQSQCYFLLDKLYRFKAERLNVDRHGFGASGHLRSDAANLPECLNYFQSHNPDLFDEYNEYVTRVFPNVYRVQATPVQGQTQLEIRVWLVPPKTRRPDISIPLSQCGTGIGQVLAILYVAMSATLPLTIAIDEPNSFLHPKAVRTLLQILNDLEIKHQYIITTHSPEVIRSSEASTITNVVNDRGVSKALSLDPSNLGDIQKGLANIGAKLSDVYGADQILWVEGETEELTFPRIASEISKIKTIGISILKVNSTGDFESRKTRPRMIFDVYTNLSKAGALLPPAIGFIFDSEGRPSHEISNLSAESKGLVHFLPRLCFENFILHPKAIAKTLSQATNIQYGEDVIELWIEENGRLQAYLPSKIEIPAEVPLLASVDWLEQVHAPKLLKDLFAKLPEQPEEYRKTTHSVEITEWLIANDPTFLKPLADVLVSVLAEH
ncbi:Chromosome partition protein Smc [Ralstonia edaphis]|uniref:ATP-dependent nuclease n=1 Tax=Ralstonia edaphi TaxID=3058599 RepID=UPI0028F536E7|nr:AAA family ATPase [Ralstonia sp. LMG 6871]CAJ0705210.1 Chromosome partition protein Smc [Ralstonia sp. LMG 6871]